MFPIFKKPKLTLVKALYKRLTKKGLSIFGFSVFLALIGFFFGSFFFKSYTQAALPFDTADNRKLSIYGGVISLIDKAGDDAYANAYAMEIDAYRIRSTSGIGVQAPLIGNLVSGPNLVKNGDAVLAVPGARYDDFSFFEEHVDPVIGYGVKQATVDGPLGGKTTAFDFYADGPKAQVPKQMYLRSDYIPINPNKTYLLEGWFKRTGNMGPGGYFESANFLGLQEIDYYYDNNSGTWVYNEYGRISPYVADYVHGSEGKWEYWSGFYFPSNPADRDPNTGECRPSYQVPNADTDIGITTGYDRRFYCDQSKIKYVQVKVFGLYLDNPITASGEHHAYWTNIRLTEINESTDLVGQHLDIDATWMPENIPEAVDNGLDAISTKINSASRSGIYAENPSGYAGYFSGKVYGNEFCLPGSPPEGGCLTQWPSGGGGDDNWNLAGSVISPKNNYRVTIGDSSLGAGEGDATLRVYGAIARQGAKLFGNNLTIGTHVNLGVDSETGTSGREYSYATVLGGQNNKAARVGATVSGGKNNQASGLDLPNANCDDCSTVSGGESNTASSDFATVSGGMGNTASGQASTVAGGQNNLASGSYSTISGGGNSDVNFANKAIGTYTTVSGGGENTAGYTAPATNFSTVGGGQNNLARGYGATVSGGLSNYTAADYGSTVSGGEANSAGGSGGQDYSTVSGGKANRAGGDRATVTGGENNQANGSYSIVEGGSNNSALGYYTWTGGTNAKTINATTGLTDDRAFVWSAKTTEDCKSHGDYTFNICAAGGIYLMRDNGQLIKKWPSDVVELMDVLKKDGTQEGEILAIRGNDKLGKSRAAYDSNLIGVVSSKRTASLYLGNTKPLYGDTEKKPVALVGRVFVNVNNENGAIKLGDPITSSSTPGLGMKATKAGKIIGYALQSENFRDKSTKEILVYVNLDYYLPQDLIKY